MAKIANKSKEVSKKGELPSNAAENVKKRNPLTTVLGKKKKAKSVKTTAVNKKNSLSPAKDSKNDTSTNKELLKTSDKSPVTLRNKRVSLEHKVSTEEPKQESIKKVEDKNKLTANCSKSEPNSKSKIVTKIESSYTVKNQRYKKAKLTDESPEKTPIVIKNKKVVNDVCLGASKKSSKGGQSSLPVDSELEDTDFPRKGKQTGKSNNKKTESSPAKSESKVKSEKMENRTEKSKTENKNEKSKVVEKESKQNVIMKQESLEKMTTIVKANQDKASVNDKQKQIKTDEKPTTKKNKPICKSVKLNSAKKKAGGRGKVAKKIPTDIYKSRHNIGRRVAAGRVCSYKETEVAFIFPDNYFTAPNVKLDTSPSTSAPETVLKKTKDEDDSDEFINEDGEVQFNFEAQKNREERVSGSGRKQEDRAKSSSTKNVKGRKRSCSRSPSPDSGKSFSKSKKYSPTKNIIKGKGLKFTTKKDSLHKVLQHGKTKFKSTKKLTALQAKKQRKKKSKFQPIVPRAPRIQRTACLNANAINSLMYDYSAPPKKTKFDEEDTEEDEQSSSDTAESFTISQESSEDEGSESTEKEDSDSDYVDETDKNDAKKQSLQTKSKKCTSPSKKGKVKSKGKEKQKEKKNVKSKKKLKKPIKRKSKEVFSVSFVPLPKRMASLNAQAIMAASKELDEMKIPTEPKTLKEDKKVEKKDHPAEKEKLDSENSSKSETSHKITIKKSPKKSVKCKMIGKGRATSPNSDDMIPEELRRFTYSRSSQKQSPKNSPVKSGNVPAYSLPEATLALKTNVLSSSTSKDPYEFVDVVEVENDAIATDRPSIGSPTVSKNAVSSPEIQVVDSPGNSPPKTIGYQQGFQPVRPNASTPKPTPHYPVNIQYPHQMHRPPMMGIVQAPFPHGGFSPTFQQHLPAQSQQHGRNLVAGATVSSSLPTQLPPSTLQQQRQHSSQFYRTSHQQQYLSASQAQPSSTFQQQPPQVAQPLQGVSNPSAFVPASHHMPVQSIPGYSSQLPAFSQQQQQQQQQLQQAQPLHQSHIKQHSAFGAHSPTNLAVQHHLQTPPQQDSSSSVTATTTTATYNQSGSQMKTQQAVVRGETPASSGRSSVSSITEQATPPGQAHNHAHKSTSMGNTATYPYPHGANTPNSNTMQALQDGSAVNSGSQNSVGSQQSFIHPPVGFGGMENYPAGYPMMAYPRHYGHHPMLGAYSQQNSVSSHRGQGNSGNENRSGNINNSGQQNQPSVAGPQNLYMGYGYYQPAGPLLHAPPGASPFHMLQPTHMKGFFAPSVTHKMTHSQPVETPEQKVKPVLYPTKAFQDIAGTVLKKQSPSKRGTVNNKQGISNSSEKTFTDKQSKPKEDVIDLSVEPKGSSESVVSKAPTTTIVSSFSKKADMIRNIIGTAHTSSSGSGGEEPSPGKQTKDILDLDSKKVKVHRGAVGETADRNSPLKIVKSSKKGNNKSDRGFPVQTYKFEAKAITVASSMQGEDSFHAVRTAGSTGDGLRAVHPTLAGMTPFVHVRPAETRTVASNMSIPFYSNPLSVQTSEATAALMGASLNKQLTGKDIISSKWVSQSSKPMQDRLGTSPSKKRSIQTNINNIGPTMTYIHNNPKGIEQKIKDNNTNVLKPGLYDLKTSSHTMKPVMPVLPIPSVAHGQNEMAIMSHYRPSQELPSHVSSSAIGGSSSYIVTSSGYKPVTTVSYLGGIGVDKNKSIPYIKDSVVDKKYDHLKSSDSTDLKGNGGVTTSVETEMPTAAGKIQSANNTNNSARGDGKKSAKKDSSRSEAKSPKKDHTKAKGASRPDSLKLCTDNIATKPSGSKSKPESPRQKQKRLLDSPKKQQSVDSPKHKASLESPKHKVPSSPKSKSQSESPKHRKMLNIPQKYKSVINTSPKQSKSDIIKVKAESPKLSKSHNPFKIKLDFTSAKLKFETHPKKKEDYGNKQLSDANSPGSERLLSGIGPGGKKRNHSSTATHSGWKWEGPPELKSISTQGESPSIRKCYPAVRHDDGDIVSLRDCVLVKSGPRKKDIPFVAKIAAFWEHGSNGEMMMSVLWYYRPEQTEMERLPRRERCEIFASRHRDVVPVACIDDKAYVLTFNEYCRFKSEQRKMAENGSNRPAIIPKPSHETVNVVSTLPPLDAAAETIFLCRRVYDMKLKRILKNPQASYIYSSPNSSKSHTPTPSSKSPSPKSVSPESSKQQVHPHTSNTLVADPNIEIMQALGAHFARSLNNVNNDLPIGWGLPGTSVTVFGSGYGTKQQSPHYRNSAGNSDNETKTTIAVQSPISLSQSTITSSTMAEEKPILPQYLSVASSNTSTCVNKYNSKSSLSICDVVPPTSELSVTLPNDKSTEFETVSDKKEQQNERSDSKHGVVNSVGILTCVPTSVDELEASKHIIQSETNTDLLSEQKNVSDTDKLEDPEKDYKPSIVHLANAEPVQSPANHSSPVLEKKKEEKSNEEIVVSSSVGKQMVQNENKSQRLIDLDDNDDSDGELVMDLDADSESDSEVSFSKSKLSSASEKISSVEKKPLTSASLDILKELASSSQNSKEVKSVVDTSTDILDIKQVDLISSSISYEESSCSTENVNIGDDLKVECTSDKIISDPAKNNGPKAEVPVCISVDKNPQPSIVDTTVLVPKAPDNANIQSNVEISVLEEKDSVEINTTSKEETAISLLSKISDSLAEKQEIKKSPEAVPPIGSVVSISCEDINKSGDNKCELNLRGNDDNANAEAPDKSVSSLADAVGTPAELNEDILSSESSTEVSRDGTNGEECTKGTTDSMPISFGLSSDSISLEICTNDVDDDANIKMPDYLNESSQSTSCCVQVDNITTTLPKLASTSLSSSSCPVVKNEEDKFDSSETSVQSSTNTPSILPLSDTSEVVKVDTVEQSNSSATEISSSNHAGDDTDYHLIKLDISNDSGIQGKPEPTVSSLLPPSTPALSVATFVSSTSGIALARQTSSSTNECVVSSGSSGLKSPSISGGSGFSRIEQIVSHIKMTGSYAAISTSSSSSTSVEKCDDVSSSSKSQIDKVENE